MKQRPRAGHAPGAPAPARGWQGLALHLAALTGPVLLVGLAAWATFGSYDHLLLALDRSSALGPCHGPDGARPLCDFANYYYPQGRALAIAPVALPGFFYSAFFAAWMRLYALLPFAIARDLWAAVVVAAALILLLAPLLREHRRSLLGCLLHGLGFACALPLWHDLAFGQVSSLLTALVALAFLAYGRERRTLAALLLGVAASIKFYPAIFAIYFGLRRDRRALLVFAGTVLTATAVLPLFVLGEAGLVAFYRSLGTGLDQLARGTAANRFSNFVANAVTHLWVGRVEPESFFYRAALAVGLGIAGLHGWLLWRVRRARPAASARVALMLGLASLPFVVRSCWVHYFVFLPLLQGYVAQGGTGPNAPRANLWLGILPAAFSAVLVSVPLFLLVGDQRLYEAALPFWATVMLLPGLYRRVRSDPGPEASPVLNAVARAQ